MHPGYSTWFTTSIQYITKVAESPPFLNLLFPLSRILLVHTEFLFGPSLLQGQKEFPSFQPLLWYPTNTAPSLLQSVLNIYFCLCTSFSFHCILEDPSSHILLVQCFHHWMPRDCCLTADNLRVFGIYIYSQGKNSNFKRILKCSWFLILWFLYCSIYSLASLVHHVVGLQVFHNTWVLLESFSCCPLPFSNTAELTTNKWLLSVLLTLKN